MVAQVTATTVVPTIFFAVMPNREHAGMNTTAPPNPVSALSAPAPVPHAAVAYCHPGFNGALTHAVGGAFGALPGNVGFSSGVLVVTPEPELNSANPFAPARPTPRTALFAKAVPAATASFAWRATIARRARGDECGAADGGRTR